MTRDYFGGSIAERYDETSAAMFAPEVVDPVVDVLVELAGSGRALEFGIGTGRIALPLAARGIDVAGIELSPDMVAQLRAKDGGARVGRRDRLVRRHARGRASSRSCTWCSTPSRT